MKRIHYIRDFFKDLESLKENVIKSAKEMGHHVTVNGHILDEKLKPTTKKTIH